MHCQDFRLARAAGVSHAAPAHPFTDGHYAVMFDNSLYDDADPALVAASAAAGEELNRGVGTMTDPHAVADPEGAALAAWSLVHGFSLLWLNGAVDTTGDPIGTVERLAGNLFEHRVHGVASRP